MDRLSQQRRDVAVLFADVSGFTPMVDAFDPEVVYDVVRPLMDELTRLVRGSGGQIQQVLGDGFMAAFGLGARTGDEAERAVQVAQDLVAAAGPVHPPVHVGVEYGQVLVTPSWERASFGVWARPVVIAKRLCDVAGPGQVQIGPGAFGHAGRAVDGLTARRFRLKGIAEPVVAYRIGQPVRPLARVA